VLLLAVVPLSLAVVPGVVVVEVALTPAAGR
jgi:hypothetical protein